MDRKQIEARRGIVKDNQGRIVRSKHWLEERIQSLQAKKDDLKNRIKNIDAEIKDRSAEMEEAE